MLTRCPHCGALALVVGKTTARYYGGALLVWRSVFCWRRHRYSTAGWE